MRETTEKLLVAVELLDRALRMYYEGSSYFAALHLAGGAEEILGVYVERREGESSLKSLVSGAVEFSKLLNDGVASNPKNIRDAINHPKNQTKHMDKGNGEYVTFDPKMEARNLLERAVSNYYTLIRDKNRYNLPETGLLSRFNLEVIGIPSACVDR